MHVPVLLQEVVSGLQAREGDIILDATVGGGGHSEALCKDLGGVATFLCLDADSDAIARSRERLKSSRCMFLFYRTNYRYLDTALASLGVAGVNRVLFDLGLSSLQLEESGRGFSFLRDEPLLMTFEKETEEGTLTARTVLNEWSEETITAILESYGEERYARRIAGRIVEARKQRPIETTFELAAIVRSAARKTGRIHPATKTFQALRIAVNDEFQGLKDGLRKAWEKLLPGGRIAVISFHSMEDRVVKDFFRELGKKKIGTVVTKKPITPGEEEQQNNPRSRSAKLRIIEKRHF
ncbi:MAG: 16S rRNA (cytosine(1402)-N(4))-methyltransferase RsmH [Patescibacteria group bacterium]